MPSTQGEMQSNLVSHSFFSIILFCWKGVIYAMTRRHVVFSLLRDSPPSHLMFGSKSKSTPKCSTPSSVRERSKKKPRAVMSHHRFPAQPASTNCENMFYWRGEQREKKIATQFSGQREKRIFLHECMWCSVWSFIFYHLAQAQAGGH